MIRTRFPPSPTGYLHIGGLRTALYNYLFAKQNKGKFVLRIEDTDQKREVKGATEALIQTMEKMGLDWDEGLIMDKDLKLAEKGRFGPYLQSKRVKIYQEYAQKLLNSGDAYICTCSPERLEKLRQEQEARKEAPRYDGHCRNLDLKPELLHATCYTIRLKVPEQGSVVFQDLIRGEIKVNASEIDDQVLLKSDGFPTYHLAVVVDDHLMEITHVIRGDEWLASTPKHILLYQAFGWQIPQFAHLPLLLNPDRSKLSKRQGDVAVEDYLAKGYLPETLINYVALLGWHPQDDREIFSLTDLIKNFDINRVQKAGAVFDLNKLNWFNCHYIKQKPTKELIKLCQKFLPNVDKCQLAKILEIEKGRLDNLSEIEDKAKMFLEVPDYNGNLLIFRKSDVQTTASALKKVYDKLNDLKEKSWTGEEIKNCLADVVKENTLTNGDVFWPSRVAVSGLEKSPSPEEIMTVLGKEESLKRIEKALNELNENQK